MKLINISKLVKQLGACLVLLGISSMGLAQQIAPVLQNEADFDFPGLKDREALVRLEFTVSSNGSVSDIKEIGGFHTQRFVSAAMDAARQLRFTPATESGSEVDWDGFRVDFRFLRKDLFNTMRPSPSSSFRDVEKMMMNNDLAGAEQIIIDVLDSNIELFYEYSFFNLKLAEVYIASGRLLEASHAIRVATASYRLGEHNNFNTELARVRDTYVVNNIMVTSDSNFASTSMQVMQDSYQPQVVIQPPHSGGNLRGASRGFGASMEKQDLSVLNYGLLRGAYLRAFYIHTALGDLKEQMDDFEKLENLVSTDINDAMRSQLERGNELIQSGQTITSSHFILNGEDIFYPSHAIFAATNVEGQIDSVDFQCESRTIRLEFQAEVEWRIPQSWGECGLRFRGESGALFSIVEFSE